MCSWNNAELQSSEKLKILSNFIFSMDICLALVLKLEMKFTLNFKIYMKKQQNA